MRRRWAQNCVKVLKKNKENQSYVVRVSTIIHSNIIPPYNNNGFYFFFFSHHFFYGYCYMILLRCYGTYRGATGFKICAFTDPPTSSTRALRSTPPRLPKT